MSNALLTPSCLAEEVLNKIEKENGKITFPIDPFKLLKDSGVLITFSDFENLEGIILNDKDDVTLVSINRLRPWSRQRFSAAHEYCHLIKDLNANTTSRIDCIINSKSPIEKYANEFAACLLMPEYKLIEKCNEYKNKYGYVDFDSVVYIAEYFGVSFDSCIYKIAYKLNMIEGDTSPQELRKRIKKFLPQKRKKELIKTTNDALLIKNIINSMFYCIVDLNTAMGIKFLGNYIYYDNKLEGTCEKNVPYILSDLLYHGEKSKFYNSNDEKISMTLGNYKLQEYVLTTDDEIKLNNCKELHKKLYFYSPYPEYAGIYRTTDAVIFNGTIQPTDYVNIKNEIDSLSLKFDLFKKNIDNYSLSEYIEKIVPFVYHFVKIHPFANGNGRVSRALLNWMLRIKGLPPIYVDDKCKAEYYSALSKIDKDNDFQLFVLFIEKRIINTIVELHNYLL